MDGVPAEVLECCEEAFLFDLARDDAWLALSIGGGGGEDALAGRAPHRPVPCVRWSTLRVLLRHASLRCRSAADDHEMDNLIVSTLLATKPLTAATVVEARERYVGSSVGTRDLVRMVTRAGALLPHALANVKAVFAVLLRLEKEAAAVAVEEATSRRSHAAAEAAERRYCIAAAHSAEKVIQYERQTHQRAAAGRLPVTTCADHATELARASAARDAAVPPALLSVAVPDVEGTVGATLRKARDDAFSLERVVHATAAAMSSPAWCYEPLTSLSEEYAVRLEERLGSVETSIAALHATARRLRCLRCGRRLLRRLATAGGRRWSPQSCRGGAGVCAAPRRPLASTLDDLRRHMRVPLVQDGACVPHTSTETVVRLLFDSLVALHPSSHGDAVVSFAAFDYLSDYCELFSRYVAPAARARVFTFYAVQRRRRGAEGSTSCAEEEWVMPLEGLHAYLSDLATCDVSATARQSADADDAAVDGGDGSPRPSWDAPLLRSFLLCVMVPRWVSAPQLTGAAAAALAA
ncbi:hypothetical protein NESM_000558800 [Novymonas esmeraldas]|uniref:Uncharacterized protein n=1 Tax=Novymonas esmeraldas TaxID=1808958 RepID=A0AAW0EQ58_9TRYP